MQHFVNSLSAGAPAPDPDCSLNQCIEMPLSTSPCISAIQEQSTSFRRKKPKTMSMVIQSQSQKESQNGKPKETTNEQHYFNKRREKKESASVRLDQLLPPLHQWRRRLPRHHLLNNTGNDAIHVLLSLILVP